MLTLSMIVKNEEKYLKECLSSVAGIADEIVIVDTGSTDKTLEIARQFNCRIFSFDWINDFSAARNYSLSKATGDWILYLDADERLTEKSKEAVNRITEQPGKTAALCIVNSVDEFKEQPQIMKYIRLFANTPGIGFTGRVHEQIEESLTKNNYNIIDTDIEILHIGYNVPQNEINEKAKRNLSILEAEYKNNTNSYYAYQLANTYAILADEEKAYKYYTIATNDNKLPAEYRVYAYMNMADNELISGKTEAAEKNALNGIKLLPNNTLINLIASQVYLRKNNFESALKYCRKAYDENNKLLKEKAFSKIMNVIINPLKIIYHGLYISLIAGKPDVFKYYLAELRSHAEKTPKQKIKIQVQFIDALLTNRQISNNDMANYCAVIDVNNLLFFLMLLKKHQNKKMVGGILEGIKDQFMKNAKFLSAYGLILLELEKYADAEEILKLGINVKDKDPATFFYLISLYVQQQKYDELGDVINQAEEEFKDFEELRDKINMLKTKLRTLVK